MRILFFAISLCQVLFFTSSEAKVVAEELDPFYAAPIKRMPDLDGGVSPTSTYGMPSDADSDRSVSEPPLVLSDAEQSPYLTAKRTPQSPPPEMNLPVVQHFHDDAPSRQQRPMTAPPEPYYDKSRSPRYLTRTPPPLIEFSTRMFEGNVISPLSGVGLVEWSSKNLSSYERWELICKYWPQ